MEFGKFKDATSLLEGYNNLEKEFTKKCQAVAELKQKLLENENSTKSLVSPGGDATLSCSSGEKDNLVGLAAESAALPIEVKSVQAEEEINKKAESGDQNDSIYAETIAAGATGGDTASGEGDLVKFSSAEWRRKVNAFFKQNSDMADSRADIAKVLLTNSDIRNSDDCLENAAKIVRESKPALINQKQTDGKGPEVSVSCCANSGEAASQKSDNGSAEKPIKEYFSDLLKRKKASPSFVLGESKTFLASTNKEIKSLSDAKTYLLNNYFN